VFHRYLVERNRRLAEKYGVREMIRRIYRKAMGVDPDLDNPRKFSEKIAWLKLNVLDPLITQCADKVAVRDYVTSVIGPEYLIPVVGIYDSLDDLDFSELPCDCVIKCTHGSHCDLFYYKDQPFDENYARRMLRHWLGLNYYYYGFEWGYKNIPPRIIVEKMMKFDGAIPVDFKIHCFNGKPKFLYVSADHFGAMKRTYYDLNWELIPVQDANCLPVEIPRPECFDEMCHLAEKLSAPFVFARTDFYLVNNKIYFGEITFYPDCAHVKWTPQSYDDEFGEMLQLPK
ncbi:MAG: hypothetical protein IJG02_01455, partial [Thermoguttaceae bacterium]|nr:hypothetical protein [Thermoguttaceae bacterium]